MWRYRPELDGLRALAVLAVLINHANSGLLPSGYLGVDAFFVLSGYVVAGSWRAKANAQASWQAFYARRIRRLLPALCLCVVASLAVGRWLASASDPAWMATGLSSLVGMANLQLWWASSSYFSADAATNPFTHTWSLGVEEQFYLLFPLVMRPGGQGRLLLWAGLGAISLAFWLGLSQVQPQGAFYLTPARIWELSLGVILQLACNPHQPACHKPQLAALGSVALVGCWLLPLRFQTAATLVAAGATALLISQVHPTAGPAGRLLMGEGLRAIGERSYGIYLWHWPLLVFAQQRLPLDPIHQQLLPLAASLGLAWLSYRWIEQPLRYRTWGRTPLRTIQLGLAMIASSAALALALGAGTKPRASAVLAARENILGEEACHSPPHVDALVRCLPEANSAKGNQRLVLLGDSHAAQLRPALEATLPFLASAPARAPELLQLTDRNIPNLLLGRDGCREPVYCLHWQPLLQQLHKAVGPGSLVVLSLYSGRLNGEQRDAAHTQASSAALSLHLQELAVMLQQQQSQLLLVADVPRLACSEGLPFETAFDRGGAALVNRECSLNNERALALRQPLQDVMDHLAAHHDNVTVWDPHDLFCDHQRCKLVDLQGRLLFWDRMAHLTGAGRSLMLEPLRTKVKSLWASSSQPSSRRNGVVTRRAAS